MQTETVIPYPVRRGKVRDVYDVGEQVVIVATDRISAFDHVIPTDIPDKGKILTAISRYWADTLGVDYHEITRDSKQWPAPFRSPEFAGRTMFCHKAKVIPYECVVRGYLAGSAWQEYLRSGTICGQKLPPGLKENFPFPVPYFTPTTKAEHGHDEPVTTQQLKDAVGTDIARILETRSVELYQSAANHLWPSGLLVADTKFEWGIVGNKIVLIDEVLTPDSSRFWPADSYRLGEPIASYDKQYVRDWLFLTSVWTKESPPPPLPPEVVEQTRQKYIQAYEAITKSKWA